MFLFVYGTLMSGERRFPQLPVPPKTIHRARTSGRLIHITPGDYPGLLEGEGTVHGELMEFDDAAETDILHTLDKIEGYYGPGQKNYYDRKSILVTREDDEVFEAWTYIYTGGGTWPEIKDGDWRRRMRE
ncbi:MAG: gamma-glutamylcyclotransferase family protein [Planctomycetota bacterium]|jgi:gamma-glutamylcyclotransferase (GGCT)/AIG2-like uncharacterized protein YtfP|nr:gamma-glutamylcyclotransferase family protein [Planctomycetota bacterium]MDP6501988.1 gamma-glutamylcyclotransferase family protein [Planctomycetota bacterium]